MAAFRRRQEDEGRLEERNSAQCPAGIVAGPPFHPTEIRNL